MNSPHVTQDSKRKVLMLYAAIGVSLALSFLPSMTAAMLSFLLFLGGLIACYIVRRGQKEGFYIHSHASYLIRIIWIVGLIMAVTMVIAVIYLLGVVDNTPLDGCVSDASVITPGMGNKEVMTILEPCMHSYTTLNKVPLFIAGGIAAIPPLLYFVIKYLIGLRAALKEKTL